MISSPPPFKVFDAVAVSSTTTYYSGASAAQLGAVTNPGNAVGTSPNGPYVTFTGNFTSTPTGTLTVEITNATDNDIRLGLDRWSTYTQIAGSGFTAGVATVTAGQINSLADFAIEIKHFGYKRVRLKYTNASGSGTITAIVNTRVVG
jgi:hypothetical protein